MRQADSPHLPILHGTGLRPANAWAVPLFAAVVIAVAQPAPGQEPTAAELGRYFGFGPMEVYKIKPAIGLLRLADVDGDGRMDAILWNATQSRIELLYQPDPADPNTHAKPPQGLEPNDLPDRGTLRRENVPVAFRVAAMDVGDLTGDGRPDIVFFGDPREVVILPGKPEGGFGAPIRTRAPEGNPRSGALALGDFNGDGRTDVALLGDEALLLFHQKPEGGLAKPLRLMHNVQQTLLMLTADLNGDGRADLIVGADDPEYGGFVFLQDAQGAMGAMQRIRIPKTRSMTVVPAPTGGHDVFSVEAATGRLKQFRWQQPDALSGQTDWPMWLHSYPVASKSKRLFLQTGDVDGDGRRDIVGLDPDAASLILFRGTVDGFLPGVAFPCLVKATDLVVSDLDGDGRDEVLCVSPEEKMIGVSHYEDGRLTFPVADARVIGEDARPQVAAFGSLTDENPAHLAYLALEKPSSADGSGGQPREVYRLHVAGPNGARETLDVGELRESASGIRFADVNQDGRNDLLLFVKFAALTTFLQTEGGEFQKLEGPATRSELVKEAPLEGFDFADVDGDGRPEVLLAQRNLVRALRVQDGRWTVIDQYNPENADAEIAGVSVLPRGPGTASDAEGPNGPRLAMYDRKTRELIVMERGASGAYAVTRSLPVGAFDLQAMRATALARGEGAILLLADAKKLARLDPDGTPATLVEQYSYETEIKDAYLADCATGDLNGDGVLDIVAVDTRKANLEVLTTLPSGKFVKALHFQVFQGKRFSGEPDRGGEPREVLVGDLNGDERDDVCLIVHDRVIIYPGQ
jgi:hypothetical protein